MPDTANLRPATMHTPVPRELIARAGELIALFPDDYPNRAALLFSAINTVSERHGLKPLPPRLIESFHPYGERKPGRQPRVPSAPSQ